MPVNGDEVDANAAALLGAVRQERGASSINVRDFRPDQDDFEHWVLLFEKAVKLATNVREKQALFDLFMEWLPLKLHSTAYATYRQAKCTTWPTLKEELIGLFIDPQERYKWQAKHTTIKWDGKESFHHLAARVIQAVDKFDKGMPDEFKTREYFFRFRDAFKKPMRRVIDMGCPANNRTIEMAKEVALRFQLSSADDDGDAIDPEPVAVAFAGANLHPDRATSLETAMAGITTQLENMAVSMRRLNDKLCDFDGRLSAVEGNRRGRDDSRGSRNREYGNNNNNYPSNNRSDGRQGDGRSNGNYGQNRQGGGYRNNRSWSRGSNNRSYSNSRNDRRDNSRRDDDRRDNRRNDDRGERRGDDRRDDGGRRNDNQNDQRSQPRGDRNDQRNQPRDDRRNRDDRGGGQNRGRSDRDNRDGQYRAVDTADEDSAESASEEEPQGAAGYSRGN